MSSARFLALGDSYTIGEQVDAGARWPVQLAAMLRAGGTRVDDPEIIATTGWTTDELAAGIARASPVGPYALVSLLIGVNNQYRGRQLATYDAEYRALLAQAIEFAGGVAGRVIVLSIPDWGVTAFAEGRDRTAVAREIDAFNAAARMATLAAGARWVDVTPSSRERRAGWEAADGLHPSGVQYGAWAALALAPARAALAARSGGA